MTADPKHHTLELLHAMLDVRADFLQKGVLSFPRTFKEPPVKLPEWLKDRAANLPTKPSQPSLF